MDDLLACLYTDLVPEGVSSERLIMRHWLTPSDDDALTTEECSQLLAQQLSLIERRATEQTNRAEAALQWLRKQLSADEELLVVGSVGLAMHGLETSDLDILLGVDADRVTQLRDSLVGGGSAHIYEENLCPEGRRGALLRLCLPEQATKLDLLLVSADELALWRAALDRWHQTTEAVRRSALMAKLQAYACGGIHYRAFKMRLYRFLLPELCAWFPECDAGQMCCALTQRCAASQRDDWPCSRRRCAPDTLFCGEHQHAHQSGQTPSLCVTDAWLRTAGIGDGTIVALAGPSCVGKTSVGSPVRRLYEGVCARSVTTRRARSGETEACEYLFESEARFEERVVAGHFFEHSHIYANQYGKLWTELLPPLLRGERLFLSLHPDTVHHYRQRLPGVRLLAVYLVPPSLACLETRLFDRLAAAQSDPTQTALRLREARRELRRLREDPGHRALFDAVLVSGDGAGGAYALGRVSTEFAQLCKSVYKNTI